MSPGFKKFNLWRLACSPLPTVPGPSPNCWNASGLHDPRCKLQGRHQDRTWNGHGFMATQSLEQPDCANGQSGAAYVIPDRGNWNDWIFRRYIGWPWPRMAPRMACEKGISMRLARVWRGHPLQMHANHLEVHVYIGWSKPKVVTRIQCAVYSTESERLGRTMPNPLHRTWVQILPLIHNLQCLYVRVKCSRTHRSPTRTLCSPNYPRFCKTATHWFSLHIYIYK